MKKKGFTLVELLAVIAILAILVIIALPNVMGMFNNAKKSSFETEVKNIVKYSGQQWMQDSLTSVNATHTYATSGTGIKKIDSLDSRAALKYEVVLDDQGRITSIYVQDGTYYYAHLNTYSSGDKGMNAEDVKSNEIMTIADNKLPTTICGASGATKASVTDGVANCWPANAN